MFILELAIYAFFAWVMYALAKKSYTYDPKRKKGLDKYLWYYIGFYTFICAIRWGVGVDSISYLQSFISGDKYIGEQNETEWLYNNFVSYIAEHDIHYLVGTASLAFLQIFFITSALKSYKDILQMIPIVMFGSSFFWDLNNGVRQMIVASAFVFVSKWIVERKYVHYIIAILCMQFVHSSSLLLLPLCLLGFMQNLISFSNKRLINISILCICLSLGLFPQFQSLISGFEKVMVLLGYDSYVDRMIDLFSGENAEQAQSFGLMKLSYFLSTLSFVYFGKELKAEYEHIIPSYNLWWFFAFFWGCCYFAFGSISYLFQRPLMYFELFAMIQLALLLNLFRKKSLFFMGIKCYPLLIFIMWISISWNIIKALRPTEPIEYVTYKTVFFHDIEDY